MKLTQEDIVEIIRLFEQSKFDVCQLEVGDLKLTLSNETQAVSPNVAPQVLVRAESRVAPDPAVPSKSLPAPTALPVPDEGLVAVHAPVIGTFYAAPEPGAEPFVAIGSIVEADTTVGLVEVMKVFNAVSAGIRGRIERVSVRNEQFVEFGQTLFLVRPE